MDRGTWWAMVHGVAKRARQDLATKQWLSSIPIHIHQIFVIHSSVNRHIGCLYILNIANSADINIGVDVCFQTRVYSGYIIYRREIGGDIYIYKIYIYKI